MKLNRTNVIRGQKRRGAVLPLVVLCTVALIGLVALAVDIGMVAVARTQVQNAADAAAMAGARTINGNADSSYNFDSVPTNSLTAAQQNQVLSKAITTDPKSFAKVNAYTFQSGNVTLEVGAYTYFYDDSKPENEGFKILFPRQDDTEPYSAVRAKVAAPGAYGFGRIFGMSSFNTNAVATAVHRPRDVVIVVDLSGSMRFQSLPGIPYSGNRTTSMNPDPY